MHIASMCSLLIVLAHFGEHIGMQAYNIAYSLSIALMHNELLIS